MPISRYYHGHGSQVMSDMQQRYGAKKGKQVFYATANKRDMNPAEESKKKKPGHAFGKQMRPDNK